MADFSALKTSIQNYIKQNGNEEITGNLLQQILLSMVSTLGDSAINNLVAALNAEIANRGNADTELGGSITTLQGVVNGIKSNVENGYVYAGIATPSTTPVSGKVFYLALNAGTYTNFGATVVPQGINILKYNGSAWSLDSFLGLDDTPTQGSNNLVKSGGVLDSIIKDGSAFDLSAYNNGTTYADLSAALTALNALPAAYKKGGMSMKYVQTSDNKYVQFRCTANEFTTDITKWAICDDSVLIDNPEFIAVWTDNEGKIVIAIENDGNVMYGAGVPQQIISYINKKIDEFSLGDIVDFLGNLITSDKTLQQLFNEKVDKENGKSLIAVQYIQEIDNPEFIIVWTDSEGKIILGIKTDGDVLFGYGIPSQIEAVINRLQSSISEINEKTEKLASSIKNLSEFINVDNGVFSIRKTIKEDIPYYLSSYVDNLDGTHTIEPTTYNEGAYLDEKIKSVPNGKHFIFITDTHWVMNNRKSMYLIEYIRRKMHIKNVIFGGDAINHYNDKYLAAQQLGLFANEFYAVSGLNALFAQGNHDGNRVGHIYYPDVPASEIYIDDDFIYKTTVKPIESKVIFNTELINKIAALTIISASEKELLTYWAKCHFYYDDVESKVRYIVINTYNDSYAQCEIYKRNGWDAMMCQFDFLAETLMATPNDYDVVIVGHTFLSYQSVSQDGATGFCSFHSLVSAFKGKTNVTISSWVHTKHDGEYDAPVAVALVGEQTKNYDFSASTFNGKLFCIQGHCHADGAFITSAPAVFVTPTTLNAREYDGSTLNSNEILTIITDCDSYSGSECVWGTHQTKTPNSVTEQIIDVITIGEDDKIHCTRIGAGVDREFNV